MSSPPVAVPAGPHPPPRPPLLPSSRYRHPGDVIRLISAGLLLAGAFAASAAAFRWLITAASPTPGGLGATEAATIAGLMGIGIPSGPAVSAVLIYRLATYWLPCRPAGSPGACCSAWATYSCAYSGPERSA